MTTITQNFLSNLERESLSLEWHPPGSQKHSGLMFDSAFVGTRVSHGLWDCPVLRYDSQDENLENRTTALAPGLLRIVAEWTHEKP